MAYALKWRLEVCWIGDGVSQMNVPSAQTKIFNNDFGANSGFVQVAGTDAPSQSNFTSACNAVATNMAAAISATGVLAQIQAWATGGP